MNLPRLEKEPTLTYIAVNGQNNHILEGFSGREANCCCWFQ
jgi:hypothetical protein